MFTEWFNRKYLEFRGDEITQDVSVAAFARYLGIPQPTVDEYLKGNSTPRNKDKINQLAAILGSEVFEAVGLNITFNSDEKIHIEINLLPEELHPELMKRIKELRAEYYFRELNRIESSDPQDE